jgi:hypothetical protein
MGVIPNYYRPIGEFYPRTANILTEAGVFPLELETYLGQAGADSIKILNVKTPIKENYHPFVRYQNNLEFVDYTKPRISAYNETFVVPVSISKKTLKSGDKSNQLASFISLIAGVIIFSTLYTIVRDCKIILNAVKIIKKTNNYLKFISEEKNEHLLVLQDPIYQSLNKVLMYRKNIYTRNLISAVVNIAMSVSLLALSVIAIGAAIAASYVLLLGTAIGAGALFVGLCIKTVVEWKGRMDKKNANAILKNTEQLKIVIPPHLKLDFQKDEYVVADGL